MELNPVTGFGVIGPTTTNVSPENLRSLVREIETELYYSEVYNIARQSLEKMLGQAASKAEIIIKAVGREAIQLALKQIARQEATIIPIIEPSANMNAISVEVTSPKSPQSSPETTVTPSAAPSTAETVQTAVATPVGVVGYNQTTNPATESEPVFNEEDLEALSSKQEQEVPKRKSKRERLTASQIAAQMYEKRKAYLQEIGEELRKAREYYSLSLQQMHYLTLVPISHLEALEQGDIDQLPEDIYIRGFIYRVANALGLEGAKLAASLPSLDGNPQLEQSWSKAELDSGFYLNSVHLYLGYAALLAGSMGGVAWLSQQNVPEMTLPPGVSDLLEKTTPQSHRQEKPTPKPGLQSGDVGIHLSSGFAPPEMMGNAIA